MFPTNHTLGDKNGNRRRIFIMVINKTLEQISSIE